MRFTDLFINRPVLATVVSLFILAMGLRSIGSLAVRQYPFTQNAVVTVSTVYTGADPDVISGFITSPLETSIAEANGIDYLSSSSMTNVSQIKATLRLNYDPLKALSEITSKVNSILYRLPIGSQQPSISIEVGETIASMYLGFYSDVLPNNRITDYLTRVVQPKLQAIEGVQKAQILGGRDFALRAWLDPKKLAGYHLTPTEVSSALAKNDFISAIGRTDGNVVVVNMDANTGLKSVDEFKKLAIKTVNGVVVHLEDVADVTLGAESYDSQVKFDGKSAVYVGIKITPSANLLNVIQKIREVFPGIQAQLPQGLQARIVYDSSTYVNSSIHEVVKTLFEAIGIVAVVIFLFLGSVRSVMIPLVTIPLSLIGAFFIMFLLGYSINLLTLLALVLAIGLVVDDAIIVVENVQRHIEEGKSVLASAYLGAKELAWPIVAISIVLIAVYVPIGFMGGLTGTLFTEFAFTLAGAVAISAIIALTLSPMMCSKMLKPIGVVHEGFSYYIDQQFLKLENKYHQSLHLALNQIPTIAIFILLVFVSNYYFFSTSQQELAPEEDQGILLSFLTTEPNSSLAQTEINSDAVEKIFRASPEAGHTFQVIGASGLDTSFAGMVLKPWDERVKTAMQIKPEIENAVSSVAGADAAVFSPAPLPGGGGGLPVQLVVTSTENFNAMNEVADAILDGARKSGKFAYITKDLKINKLQTTIKLDREKLNKLGLSMQDVGQAVSSGVSQGYINYFDYDGRSYQVISQMKRDDRENSADHLNYYIKVGQNKMIPLSTIASIQRKVVPTSLSHFQGLNSVTISGVPMPGLTMGESLDELKRLAANHLNQNYYIDYSGQSRQYVQESSALFVAFAFSLIIIFLSLAALFESFRDPLIVLITVPLSLFGAMLFVTCFASLNIYTEVGLITLIGLISKHGILIVQFANDLQAAGKSKREAVEMASSIRLRPILMTTAATVLGVVPLLLASGAGAVSRFNIGLVIATGIGIGTFFTLYLVPAVYLLIAEEKKVLENGVGENVPLY